MPSTLRTPFVTILLFTLSWSARAANAQTLAEWTTRQLPTLLETYRGQFRKLIAQRGYDGLLETLKQKRDQLEKKAAQTLR